MGYDLSSDIIFLLYIYLNNNWQTDKASMLDEIIDYVKFLQLQVKVNLSSIFPILINFSFHLSSAYCCYFITYKTKR